MQRRGGGAEGGDVEQSGPERDEGQIGRAGGGQCAGLGVGRGVWDGFPIEEVETRYSASAKATRQVGELLISGGDSPARPRPGPPGSGAMALTLRFFSRTCGRGCVAASYLREGVDFAQLDAEAHALRDNEAARRLNAAREELFRAIRAEQPLAA